MMTQGQKHQAWLLNHAARQRRSGVGWKSQIHVLTGLRRRLGVIRQALNMPTPA
jgi:hypothetical protein